MGRIENIHQAGKGPGLARNVSAVLLAALAAFSLAGCTGINFAQTLGNATAVTHPAPEYARFYTVYYRGGAMYHSNSVPGQVGSDDVPATKTGKACSHSVLWLASWGNSGIETAKRNGKITRIQAIEHHIQAIGAYIYHRHCTVVIGS